MLTNLERVTCGLIEGEASLQWAMGQLWEVLSDDIDDRVEDRPKNARSAMVVGSATDDFFKDPNSFPIDIYHLIHSQCASAEHCVSNPIACVTTPWGSMSLLATEKCVDRFLMSSYM